MALVTYQAALIGGRFEKNKYATNGHQLFWGQQKKAPELDVVVNRDAEG
jgi:hypothetical protein